MARGVNTKANGIDFRANRFDEFLKLIPQNLTSAEKAQVLENIGAIGEEDTLMTINGTGVKKGDAVTTSETAIVVDGEMSDSSTNAPQNKVVKAYVDAADKALQDQIGNVPADYIDLPYAISAGYINAADGTEASSTSNHKTDYIDVSAFNKIKFLGIKVKSTSYTSGFAFYDENKQWISGLVGSWLIDTDMAESVVQHEYVVDVPSGAKYFRTTLRDALVTKSDFYMKGQENLAHMVGTKADSDLVNYDRELVSLDHGTLTDNRWINPANGVSSSTVGYKHTSYINVQYLFEIEFVGYIATVSTERGAAFYDKDKNFISGFAFKKSTSGSATIYKLNVPKNAVYFRTSLSKNVNPDADFYVKAYKTVKSDTIGHELRITELETESKDIAKDIPMPLSVKHIVGAGNDTIYGYIYGIIPGHSYRLYLNKDIDMSDVTVTGAYRLYIYQRPIDSTTNLTEYRVGVGNRIPDHYDFTAVETCGRLYIGGRWATDAVMDLYISDLTASGQLDSTSILGLNPDSEFKQKIRALRKYNHNDDSKIRPVMFAHMSDIHGGTYSGGYTYDSVKRFIEFCNHHHAEFSFDMVQTGDLVPSEFTNGIDNYNAITGSEKIINVIGNHDTNESDSAGGWRQHIGVDAYNRYIKDNVAGWNVTQPENAETLGKCYFYKDYSQSSTAVLRAIFLDIMGFDSTEKTWLEEALASAKTAGLPVVIFTHFVDDQFTSFKTNYSSLFGVGTTRSSLLAYNPNLSDYPVSSAVDAFQQDGGVFAGYVIGHYHRDMVAHLNQYPQQMVYSVSSNGGASELRDWEKVAGNRNIDDFQLVSVDTYAKEVKLCKVGANIDYYCREKSMCSVDFKYYGAFSESDAYSVGDKVFQNGKVYKFIADHSAGAWDASEVEEWDRIISNH